MIFARGCHSAMEETLIDNYVMWSQRLRVQAEWCGVGSVRASFRHDSFNRVSDHSIPFVLAASNALVIHQVLPPGREIR